MPELNSGGIENRESSIEAAPEIETPEPSEADTEPLDTSLSETEEIEETEETKETEEEIAEAPLEEVEEKEDENPEKMDEVELRFKCNVPEGLSEEEEAAFREEFASQLQKQEDGLNSQSLEENITNREAYFKRKEETGSGRAVEGTNAQRVTREELKQKDIINRQGELYEDNSFAPELSDDERYALAGQQAEAEITERMKTQDVLHNPDQRAGGNPEDVGELGDRRVNRRIGPQWRRNEPIMSDEITRYVEEHPDADLSKVKMNVKLIMD